MIDPLYLLSVLIFIAILAIIVYRDRKNIEFKYILIMRRTKRFRQLIDSIAQISPRFWKAVYTIAVLVTLYYMANGVYLLLDITYKIYIGAFDQPVLQFILPSLSSTPSSGPGYITLPFWPWLITILIVLVPHELSHGIIARAEKIKLKSVGLLLLAIFPGAFVEPDAKQLKKSKTLTKLRIFSAGSFMNFVVAALTFLLVSFLIWPAISGTGIELLNVTADSPAHLAGLEAGMLITQMNNNEIKTTYNEYLAGRTYLMDELVGVKTGDTINVVSDGNSYDIKLVLNPETNSTYMGITYTPVLKTQSSFIMNSLIPLLTMIWLFSFAIGLFNILPIYPLDGGLMVEAIAERFTKKNAKKIALYITYIMLLILLYDFVMPFF